MIKTIQETDLQRFEDAVNAFEKTQSVFATQTHITERHTYEGLEMIYTAVIFYKVRP